MVNTKDLVKSYFTGDIEQPVLRGITLSVARGEFISIIGPSGSGKSTLLYQLSLLDEPTSGEVFIDGVSGKTLKQKDKAFFRLQKMGFVFQDYAILPELTALENVMLPLIMEGYAWEKAELMAKEVLTKVGLAHRFNNVPSRLSGGEQQRVSIARAIGNNPPILFADEPTANLDSTNSKEVMKNLLDLKKEGQTILLVTHEEEYAYLADRVIFLKDGQIVDIKKGNLHGIN
jgi:putative ABC transport system ATP-binding protein